jgi:hypothetical protein
LIVEDLAPADIILSVKEVPPAQLLPGKTYVMFSHTHKGQAHNMPMLQAVLDRVRRRPRATFPPPALMPHTYTPIACPSDGL